MQGCSDLFIGLINKNKKKIIRDKFEKGKKLKLLFVGQLNQRKGIDILMEIFEKLDQSIDNLVYAITKLNMKGLQFLPDHIAWGNLSYYQHLLYC